MSRFLLTSHGVQHLAMSPPPAWVGQLWRVCHVTAAAFLDVPISDAPKLLVELGDVSVVRAALTALRF
jgi:hypothetical protein